MKKSFYFAELASAYDAEIQDLLCDSEGKSALQARLREKRRELKAILPMLEFSPEMVMPVFYDAFVFGNPRAMADVLRCEPDDGDFPGWDDLVSLVGVEPWARAHVDMVLGEPAGDAFMVSTACMEFVRKYDHSANLPAASDDEDADTAGEAREGDDADGDDAGRDLAEAGEGWLGEQGFDSLGN